MQRLFSSDGLRQSDAQKVLADLVLKEFYDGDMQIASGELKGMTVEKALQHPISLTHISSKTQISYRRSTQHIRNNRVGFRVIWFVRHGAVKIVRANGACVIKAGEAGIVDSNLPFFATSLDEGDQFHESYQAIIPPDMFLTHLSEAERYTGTFSLETPEGKIVQRLLDLIVENGDRLGRQTATSLVNALLEAIGDELRASCLDMPRRQRLVDRRLADIENYILMNLTDPDLCYDKVAACCGISPRYLSYLLKANNTSFSDLLWKNRLPKARDWLASPTTRDYPIQEIAYMSGFKSAAHFSRMFKSAYGCSPREYRAAQADETALA